MEFLHPAMWHATLLAGSKYTQTQKFAVFRYTSFIVIVVAWIRHLENRHDVISQTCA